MTTATAAAAKSILRQDIAASLDPIFLFKPSPDTILSFRPDRDSGGGHGKVYTTRVEAGKRDEDCENLHDELSLGTVFSPHAGRTWWWHRSALRGRTANEF
jgi:hypothetical protein